MTLRIVIEHDSTTIEGSDESVLDSVHMTIGAVRLELTEPYGTEDVERAGDFIRRLHDYVGDWEVPLGPHLPSGPFKLADFDEELKKIFEERLEKASNPYVDWIFGGKQRRSRL